MTRGFITIATGKKHYSEIAANLLKSYRYFSKSPFPFAVIAEEHNEYTDLFDDVIITDEATRSFMDKFLLMKLCPYDETIFIDADSFAYNDLNCFWDFFKDATDFSAIGINYDKKDPEGAWYNIEDIWKYGDLIPYKCRVHSGVIFVRKSSSLKKLYDDSIDVYRNYDKLHFHTCPNSYDECVLGISMPMNNMKAIREDPELFACYPVVSYLKTDMLHGKLSFANDWDGYTDNSVLLHFGTDQTYQPLYLFDNECLDYLIEYKDKKAPFFRRFLYEKRIMYYCMKVPYEIKYFFTRAYKKAWKTLFGK